MLDLFGDKSDALRAKQADANRRTRDVYNRLCSDCGKRWTKEPRPLSMIGIEVVLAECVDCWAARAQKHGKTKMLNQKKSEEIRIMRDEQEKLGMVK